MLPFLSLVTFISPPRKRSEFAGAVRFVFAPVMILSGCWMYAGVIFATIGVALWLGVYQLFGVGTAILSQFALFIARKIWLMVRARRLA